MATPGAMRRLHRIREAEEEQKKSALAAANQELHRLESARELAHARTARGKIMLHSGDPIDRIAGCEEVAAAGRLAKFLAMRIHAVAGIAEKLQQEFLAKRVERRQVETMLESAMKQDIADDKRKSQMALDDWHRSRRL